MNEEATDAWLGFEDVDSGGVFIDRILDQLGRLLRCIRRAEALPS
jgi:hypothetical protein